MSRVPPALRFVLAAAPLLACTFARAETDPGAEAKASYTIETGDSTREAKVGDKGKVVLFIHPKEKIHVHPSAPLKIKLDAPAGLKLEKGELGHKDANDPKAEAPRFEIPFTAASAGKQEVKANFDFFICSDTWCVKQVQTVSVAVNVK